MPIKKDADGRRSVQAQVEVPGTPEEVWAAIATGQGISSWFVPTELDGREGGKAVSHFAPDGSMDSEGRITAWKPPHSFTAVTDEGPGPVATEWIVEARTGGTCVVRVVHSWFASSDDWDAQFEGHEFGWAAFFQILRLYLAHFRGQAGSSFQVMGMSQGDVATAWAKLAAGLGLSEAAQGQAVRSPEGAPPLAGVVEQAGPPEYPMLLLRLQAPAPGLAHLFAMPMGGQVLLPVRLYLYGEQAAEAVAAAEPRWKAWMAEQFPAG